MDDLDSTKSGAAGSAPDERYHHGDLRRALIQAALVLLTEEQDWSFSLREVARRASVSHTAPYNHFAGKQELLAALASVGYDSLTMRLREAVDAAENPPAALAAAGAAYVRFGVENPAHYKLMFGALFAGMKNADAPDLLAQSAAAAKGVLGDVIRRGVQGGSLQVQPPLSPVGEARALDAAVLTAWSLVHGLTMLLIDGLAGGPLDASAAEQSALQAARLLLTGLAATQPDGRVA